MKGILSYIDTDFFKLPHKDVSLMGIIAIPFYLVIKLFMFIFMGIRFRYLKFRFIKK